MQKRGFRHTVAMFFSVLALAGCAADMQPFVYISNEFDRTRKDYGQPPKDITEAIICYNKYKTKPETVRNMAALECARFNKQTIFQRQDMNLCPLLTPTAAIYRCRGEEDRKKEEAEKAKQEKLLSR